MTIFIIGFVLGGMAGAVIMIMMNARKNDELLAEIEEHKIRAEEWEKKYQDTEKELKDLRLVPQPTITMYRGDTIPIECSIAFDRHDFEEIPAEWLKKEVISKLSEGIEPYIDMAVVDDFYKFQKVVKGRVIVVKK